MGTTLPTTRPALTPSFPSASVSEEEGWGTNGEGTHNYPQGSKFHVWRHRGAQHLVPGPGGTRQTTSHDPLRSPSPQPDAHQVRRTRTFVLRARVSRGGLPAIPAPWPPVLSGLEGGQPRVPTWMPCTYAVPYRWRGQGRAGPANRQPPPPFSVPSRPPLPSPPLPALLSRTRLQTYHPTPAQAALAPWPWPARRSRRSTRR